MDNINGQLLYAFLEKYDPKTYVRSLLLVMSIMVV